MNEIEKMIKEKYENEGYDVIHVGVPDFICLRKQTNPVQTVPDQTVPFHAIPAQTRPIHTRPLHSQILFVEVKYGKDELRDTQKRAISLLKKHGFDVKIERVPIVQESSLKKEFLKKEVVLSENSKF